MKEMFRDLYFFKKKMEHDSINERALDLPVKILVLMQL